MGEMTRFLGHRERIDRLQAAMRREDPLEIAHEDKFCPGVYMRVIHMPAGATIVSKIHKTEHFCVALTGRAVVVYPDRKETVEAPQIMVTTPGTQRALYILEDSTWLTIHPTRETDVEVIEQNIIAKDFNDPVLIEYFGQQGLLTHED